MCNIEALRRSELCNGLSDAELENLAKIFHCKFAKKNEVVLEEGKLSNELYIISRGRISVNILSSSSPGEYEKIATLRDNDVYGEFAMLDGSTRSASIVAEEDSNFLYVDYLDFHRFLEENEHVGFIVMRNLAKILTAKLRKTNFEIRDGIF